MALFVLYGLIAFKHVKANEPAGYQGGAAEVYTAAAPGPGVVEGVSIPDQEYAPPSRAVETVSSRSGISDCSRYHLAATLTSYHFKRDPDYNERNYGLGLECTFTRDWRGHAGFYRNTFNRNTTYAFASNTPWRLGPWKVGYVFGAGTGYTHAVDPVAGGFLIREWKDFGINVAVHPAAIALQIKWRLQK